MSKENLQPDATDMQSAAYNLHKRCPFCNAHAGPLCGYVNNQPTFSGGEPVYQYILACGSFCGGQVIHNAKSRDAARDGAIERWNRRPPLPNTQEGQS